MKIQTFWTVAALASLLVSPAGAQQSDRTDGMRFVPNVIQQFEALTELADPLGFHISTTPDPSQCRHYQAITRVDGADGTPFFLVTRSGNKPDIVPDEIFCDDSPGETRNGNLIVFRMGSRDKNGERLRSNRLRKGVHVDSTPPPAADVATIFFTVVGGDPADPDPAKRPGLVFRNGEGGPVQRVYGHPGGMQLVGHMLAVAADHARQPSFFDPTYDAAPHPSVVLLFDVSDPEAPVFKSQFAPLDGPADDPASKPLPEADGMGLTPLPGGLYLMAVKGGSDQDDTVYFYRSTTGDLASPDLAWQFVAKSKVSHVRDSHQTFQFLREGNIHGTLFMAGARGNPVFGDRDRIDLYRVDCLTDDCEPGDAIGLTLVAGGKRMSPFPSTGGTRLANLAAATGFHVTPSGELLFYATEHDNDGPDGTVKAGEWRHQDMARPGSPTLLPTAKVNGPYEVDEGSSVSLSGTVAPPITRAWIQLYDAPDFHSFDTVVNFDDFALDDFDNFFVLEPLFGLLPRADQARSWKWFAPAGCSIFTMDHEQGTLDEALTLVGDGTVHQDPDLSQVLNNGGTDDINLEIDAVAFLAGCDRYYSTPFSLRWDLDLDGSFETSGSSVTFSAAAFDGPSDVSVPAQTQHPSGGPVGTATARVHVRNVAPQVTQVRITDGAGNDLPFGLPNVPVTAGAAFGDPGRLDHQTATLSWGDGTVDPQSAFLAFDEAFGDGSGSLSQQHRYTAAGVYPVVLSVSDDDGGTGGTSTAFRVVTPLQASEEILGLLNGVIAGTNNAAVLKDLEKARKALAGNPNGNNGALQKIRDGNNQAAIAFLQQAITALRKAQAGGASTPGIATLIVLLEQVASSLSAA